MRIARNTKLFTLALLAVVLVLALGFTLITTTSNAFAAEGGTNYTESTKRDGAKLELFDGEANASGKAFMRIDVVYPDAENGQDRYTIWTESVTIRVSIINDSGIYYEFVGYMIFYNTTVFGEPEYTYKDSHFVDYVVKHDRNGDYLYGALDTDNAVTEHDLVLFEATFPINDEYTLEVGDTVPFYFDDPTGMVGDTMILGSSIGDDPDFTCKELEITFEDVDNGLKELTIDGVDATVYGFRKNVSEKLQEITLADVEYDVKSITLDGAALNESAVVSGLGVRELEVGDNAIEVKVTLQGVSATYRIKVLREENTVAEIVKFELLDGETNYFTSFDPKTFEYNLAVPFATTVVRYVFEVAPDATYEIKENDKLNLETQEWTLDLGAGNRIEIEVTSQDKATTNTYVVNIDRKDASVENRLEALSITYDGDVEILSGFDSDKYSYEVVIPYRVHELKVSGVAKDYTSVIKVLAGDVEFEGGMVLFESGALLELTVRVIPQAEYGESKDYKVIVNRTPVSSVATLASLEVEGYELTPEFSSGTLTYSLTTDVAALTKRLEIKAVASFSEASIVLNNDPGIKDGMVEITDGSGIIRVTVIAEDGINYTEYRINYNKIAASTDATLSVLEVVGHELTPGFNKHTYNYTLQAVDSNVESLVINAIATDSKASVSGAGEVALKDGPNEIEIVVTAESGITAKYVISVTKSGRADPNALLSALSIQDANGNELLEGFDPNRLTYTLTVANEISYVKVSAQSKYSFTGNGPQNLAEGPNNIYVEVNGEEGARNVYIVTIIRSAPLDRNALLSSLSVVDYEISPAFYEGIFSYTLTVAYNVSSVTVLAEVKAPASLISGTGVKELVVGENVIEIEVEAQAGNRNVYRLVVIRLQDATQESNGYTAKLTGDGTEVEGEVEDGKYVFSVEAGVEKWVLEVVADGDSAIAKINGVGEGHRNAKIEIYGKDLGLYPRKNSYRVEIIPASGEAKTYEVEIIVSGMATGVKLPTAVSKADGGLVLQVSSKDELTAERIKDIVITVEYEGGTLTGKASELGAKVTLDEDNKVIRVAIDGKSIECKYEIVKGSSSGVIVVMVLFIVLFVIAALLTALFYTKWKKAKKVAAGEAAPAPVKEKVRKPAPVQRKPAPVQKSVPEQKSAPVQKSTPAPVRKASPAPAQKSAPAPVRKPTQAPVHKASSAPVHKAGQAPVHKAGQPVHKSGAPVHHKPGQAPVHKSGAPVHHKAGQPVHKSGGPHKKS